MTRALLLVLAGNDYSGGNDANSTTERRGRPQGNREGVLGQGRRLPALQDVDDSLSLSGRSNGPRRPTGRRVRRLRALAARGARKGPLLVVALAALVVPSIANAATLQQRGDETAAWMAQVLRAQVTPRTFEVGTVSPDAAGEATVDGVVRLDQAPAIDTAREVYIRVHELAHRPENQACWGWINDDGSLSPDRATEEGIADALTRDLLPAALARFAPRDWSIVEFTSYDREVAGVRYAVRKLTGGRGWGYPERRKLRELWAADCAGRAEMLREAGER